jgi:hypothetical protein
MANGQTLHCSVLLYHGSIMVPLPGGLPNNQRLQHAQPIQENDLPGVTASTEIHLRPTAGGIEITWKITRKLRSSAGK